VAALLGAYCVLFRHARLRWRWVHLVFLRPHTGTFEVPCPLLGGVWLLQQAVEMGLARRAGDGGVAFVSHLTGFGLGLLVAALAETLAAARRGAPAPSRP
jgi:membrane associated rhomboid family serine protease